MKYPFLYVANWKMNSSFEQSLTFCTSNKDELLQLSTHSDVQLVLCPSFPALYPIAQLFTNSSLAIGAQNCSEHEHGAYTGQVDALSLAQVGCTYCIIGHSELRASGETNAQIGKKFTRLREQNIVPIVCVGETKMDYEQGKTYALLQEQLMPVREAMHANDECIIAYEPVWAIGIGIPPSTEYVTKVFFWLREYCANHLPGMTIRLLYGGSVNETDAAEFKKISGIDGFLIGSASLDFQKLQKIVVCT
jgi:triosephosphate isomerase (TIM)